MSGPYRASAEEYTSDLAVWDVADGREIVAIKELDAASYAD